MRAVGVGAVAGAFAAACGADAVTVPDAVARCEPGPGWTAAPPVALGPIQETAAVALDGAIYVLGGFDGRDGVTRAVQIFDLARCTWSRGPDLPRPVHHANAVVVGHTIWIAGALTTDAFAATGATWSWTPATDAAWTIWPAMPAGTARGAAVVGTIGSVIYLAGGLRGDAISDAIALDTATMTWTALPDLPAARDHACGGVVDGALYVIGGRVGTTASIAADVYAYTPGGAWLARAPMPTARGGMACGVIDDRIVVAGGEGNGATASGVFAEVEAYAPARDAWDVLPPMRTPRHGMAGAAWDGRLDVAGGATREGLAAVDTHEILTP